MGVDWGGGGGGVEVVREKVDWTQSRANTLVLKASGDGAWTYVIPVPSHPWEGHTL